MWSTGTNPRTSTRVSVRTGCSCSAGSTPPYRYLLHVLQITSLYVGQLGPSAYITNAAFFQGADELRALQWVAYRSKSLSLTHGPQLANTEATRLIWEDDSAWQPAREALEIRRSHADVRGEAVSLVTLGTIELARGKLEAAEELFSTAREIRESMGDRAGVMQAYNALGVVAFERGDAERALEWWRAALQEARKMADRHTQTFLLNNLGEALTAAGRLDEAEVHLREARELAHTLKNRRATAEVERNLGLLSLRRGDSDAERVLMRALALAEEYGSLEAIALAHRAIGQLRAQTLFDDNGGLSRRAEESFLASIDTFREIGNEKEAARSLALLGYHLIERGDHETARERLREARAIMRRIGLAQLAKVEATLEELG